MLRGCVLFAALLGACFQPVPPSTDPVATTARKDGRDVVATAEDIERSPNESVESYLQGRSAGVVVSRTTDGGFSIRIRGATSILGNNEPLYIVDGVPFAPSQNGSLVGINPYDILSIRVLKDPIDITMYGARGANGIILIKTKSP